MLVQLIYASAGLNNLTDADIQDILTASRRNNPELGVRGLLLSLEKSFFQILEGERGAVRGLYAKVSQDPRHTHLCAFPEIEISEREFGDWSMGYDRLTPDMDGAEALFHLTRRTLGERTRHQDSS